MDRKISTPVFVLGVLVTVLAATILVVGIVLYYQFQISATPNKNVNTKTNSTIQIATSTTQTNITSTASTTNLLSNPCSLTTSSPQTTSSMAASLHTLNSNSPISWKEGGFTFTLIAVSIGYGDSRFQGSQIGELNCKYGIDNNSKLSIISVRVEIHNDNTNNISTAPFDIVHIADENGDEEAPYDIFTVANRSFTLGPNETITGVAAFLISDSNNIFLFAAGSPPGIFFTASRIPANGGMWLIVQENVTGETDCTPVFLSTNAGSSLSPYESCPSTTTSTSFRSTTSASR